MNPPKKHSCHSCHASFLIQDIGEGVVTARVIACPKCGKRWRERQFIMDNGGLQTVCQEVDDDVRLTTRSWLPDDEALKDRYHDRCLRLAAELHALLGRPRTIFLRMIAEHGAMSATKRLIHAREPSATFTDLIIQSKPLDLTVEATIIAESEWNPLFNDSDRAAAKKRLIKHGWSPPA